MMEYNQRKTCLSPDSLVNKLRSAWNRAESRTSKIARALMDTSFKGFVDEKIEKRAILIWMAFYPPYRFSCRSGISISDPGFCRILQFSPSGFVIAVLKHFFWRPALLGPCRPFFRWTALLGRKRTKSGTSLSSV